VATARKSCLDSLRQYDKSSYILSAYVPAPARDTFLAIRAFNVEVSKISGNESSKVNNQLKSTIGISSTDLRIKIWEDLLLKLFQDPYSDRVIGEPVGILLRESLKNEFKLNPSQFDLILSTRNDFLKRQSFRDVDQLCSYGEGLYSQLNYLVQDLLLSDQLSPSTVSLVECNPEIGNLIREISAHIGQATGVASIVLGTQYYGRHHNRIYLPLDLMTQHDLSQEDLLRLFQGHDVDKESISHKLKDVVYETCITANDHLITARSKLEKVKSLTQQFLQTTNDTMIIKRSKQWKKGIPDCIFVGFMNAIPLDGYLKELERHDFNIIDKKIENAYWKLVYRTYRSYQTRSM
jgi:NADH dehydrogenase [ubiquinone] 1 alpha subcomplex assembly factor 6